MGKEGRKGEGRGREGGRRGVALLPSSPTQAIYHKLNYVPADSKQTSLPFGEKRKKTHVICSAFVVHYFLLDCCGVGRSTDTAKSTTTANSNNHNQQLKPQQTATATITNNSYNHNQRLQLQLTAITTTNSHNHNQQPQRGYSQRYILRIPYKYSLTKQTLTLIY